MVGGRKRAGTPALPVWVPAFAGDDGWLRGMTILVCQIAPRGLFSEESIMGVATPTTEDENAAIVSSFL